MWFLALMTATHSCLQERRYFYFCATITSGKFPYVPRRALQNEYRTSESRKSHLSVSCGKVQYLLRVPSLKAKLFPLITRQVNGCNVRVTLKILFYCRVSFPSDGPKTESRRPAATPPQRPPPLRCCAVPREPPRWTPSAAT